MSNELTIKKPPFRPLIKPTGLAARRAAALAEDSTPEIPALSPNTALHRIGIVFDDSISMDGTAITDTQEGCVEFLRSCEKDKTAVALYPMNAENYNLTLNLPALAILAKGIEATGGTPLVCTLDKILRENNLTRAIVFSDGQPNSYSKAEYQLCIERKIPIDAVYIADQYVDSAAEEFMQKLAADTSGIYLRFDRAKSNFRTAFKYLSPGLRYMLADKSFTDKLQGI